MNSHQTNHFRMLIVTALFAAITGILAQVTIPLPLVPITGQTLAIGLTATILGSRYGTLSVLVYVLIGATGIPVYAGFSGGLSVLFGPTGGFLLAFIPATFLIGFVTEKTKLTFWNSLMANVLGMFVTLSIGTVFLKYVASLSWQAAFMGGFVPFIIVGVIKAALAAWIGIKVREALVRSKLILQGN
ncbi:biotin transporter BioY [Bacillus sp. DX4.1]|uniref:biotin transporter BioY n=1 Tax=Bacillus sp. DX4.1 TaxID=3055867 RepID=UPI0025A1593A|nr:biotin transporter BioY [Bacillus sp. DX4.1]MDM5190686.1 biotin transporter BioY [Bacillus sp. DX4.1]